MADSLKEKSIWIEKEVDRPLVTAAHFGFMPIEAPRISKTDMEITSDCIDSVFDAAEKAAFIRSYIERNLASLPHPLSLSYRRDVGRGRDGYSLHFVGLPSGLADAAIMRATLSILSDFGYKNLKVALNFIGDKESMSAHERELQTLFRKFGSEIPESIHEAAKQNIFDIFRLDSDEAREWRGRIPPSISFLSTQSRNYFKDVLEYVEMLGIDFELNHDLVGERAHVSNTIFTIRDNKDPHEILAVGYHYSRLSKRLGLRRELPLLGATIFKPKKKEDIKFKIYRDLPGSKFYLVQLSKEAKMKSLPLLETLRQEHIRVHHLLGRDKITVQLQAAETLPITHHIIIGQKEALEDTAIVRNISTRAQITVPLAQLARCLKCLPI